MIPQEILKDLGSKRDLSDSELEVFLPLVNGESPTKIAKELQITPEAVRQRMSEVYKKFNVGGGGPGKLAKLQQILASEYQTLTKQSNNKHRDLREAIDVSVFFGRTEEQKMLKQWIISDRCRLLLLQGMGGIGKTALTRKLVKEIEDEFEYVIWRSLKDAPSVQDLLNNLCHFFENNQGTEPKSLLSLSDNIARLIDYLEKHRCLLVLDNAESIIKETNGSKDGLILKEANGFKGKSILQEANASKDDLNKSEEYGKLLKRLGEASHQSCVILTSREKPKEIVALEGGKFVRSLELTGLQNKEAQEILKAQGLYGSEQDKETLVKLYRGNPLALKIVSATIKDLFNGNISDFIAHDITVISSINEILSEQIERLSELEINIMYWLAINREPVSVSELINDIVLTPVSSRELIEGLESLARRSLIERKDSKFSLQPVVMEYMIAQLIEKVCQEINNYEQITILRSHALSKALADNHVREAQGRLILKPIAERLLIQKNTKYEIKKQLTDIILKRGKYSPNEPGYIGGNILNLLIQLDIDLKGVDFSYTNVRQAYLQNVELHEVNFSYSDLSNSLFTQNLGNILSVAFSPKGEFLATGDGNNRICLWRISDRHLLTTYEGHTSWVRSVAFHPDQDGKKILASGSNDKTVRLWDVDKGQCLKVLDEGRGQVWSVAFSPDGQFLAAGCEDKAIIIWNVSDVRNAKLFKILLAHTSRVESVAFSPDSQTLASGSDDRTIKLWDINTGEVLRTLEKHTEAVKSVVFSPKGQTLASGSEDRTINLWDITTGDCFKTLDEHTDEVQSVAFCRDCQILISASKDNTVKLWDISTGEYLNTLQGHTNQVRSVTFSPDYQTLASGSDDQTVKLWDVNTGECLKTLHGHSNQVWSVALSPDGVTLASTGNDKTIRLWDVNTAKCIKTLRGHTNWVWSVAFSPDGKTLASGSDDQTVRLWDVSEVKTAKCIETLQEDNGRVWAVTFSPDGATLASSDDPTVRLWDIRTGKCFERLQEHTDHVRSVAFSPDGQTLASGSDDKTIKLWDVKTGECKQTLMEHTQGVWSVTFSPNGQLLASGSDDKTIKLWDIKTGECLKTFYEHNGRVWSVAFSPDGLTLASGSDDQTVRLWDVRTDECLKILRGHQQGVWSVAFSPNGQTLVSGSPDESIRLWDVITGECLKPLRAPRPYEGMNIIGVTGLTPAQLTTLKALGAVEVEVEK